MVVHMDPHRPLSEILMEASRLVEGGWCQVDLVRVGDFALRGMRDYCLLGALIQACNPVIPLPATGRYQTRDDPHGHGHYLRGSAGSSDRAAEQFLRSLGNGQTQLRVRWNKLVEYCQRASGYFDLQEFNDADGRTADEVIDVLTYAAALARQDESG